MESRRIEESQNIRALLHQGCLLRSGPEPDFCHRRLAVRCLLSGAAAEACAPEAGRALALKALEQDPRLSAPENLKCIILRR